MSLWISGGTLSDTGISRLSMFVGIGLERSTQSINEIFCPCMHHCHCCCCQRGLSSVPPHIDIHSHLESRDWLAQGPKVFALAPFSGQSQAKTSSKQQPCPLPSIASPTSSIVPIDTFALIGKTTLYISQPPQKSS